MRFRSRWPFRRRQAPVARQADDAYAATAGQAEPFEPDAGLMAQLSERASQRDALPILGRQGGLAATARFLTAAREVAATLPAIGWSQEVVDAAQPPATVTGSSFITTLPSLSSFRDPAAIVSGDGEGSPFPEWGSSGASTGVFAGAGQGPEGGEGSRPRQATSRASIVARLAGRHEADSPATLGRKASPARPASSGGAPTAPPQPEPSSHPVAQPRRGLITEQPAAARATSRASEQARAQPHIQRVIESESADVPTPAITSETAPRPTPAMPSISEEIARDVTTMAGRADEPPMQAARLAEMPSSPVMLPPSGAVPLPEEAPGFPSVTGATPVESPDMPLVVAEPPVEPVAAGLTGTDGPDVVARISSLVEPPETADRLVAADLSDGSRPFLAGEDATSTPAAVGQDQPELPLAVAPESASGSPLSIAAEDAIPSPHATGQDHPELPLAPAPEAVRGAQAAPPASSPDRTATSPGEHVSVQPPTAAPVHRLTVENVGESAAQPGPMSAEGIPEASSIARGAEEFRSPLSELDPPLLFTEPWAAETPGDVHQPTGDRSAFDSAPPGATEPFTSAPSLRTLRARPASAVSRSVGTSSEAPRATPMSPPPPGGREVSPRGGSRRPGEPQTERVPALERLSPREEPSPLTVPAFRPVSRLAEPDENDASVWPFERASSAEPQYDEPGRWLGGTPEGPSRAFAPPALDEIAPPMTWAAPGAAPAMARPSLTTDRWSTSSRVSRLADLPLAPAAAVAREAEGAAPATSAAEPATGMVSAAAPASPSGAAASEGEIDKLADRVWQVIRRRLQIERERQRGLP